MDGGCGFDDCWPIWSACLPSVSKAEVAGDGIDMDTTLLEACGAIEADTQSTMASVVLETLGWWLLPARSRRWLMGSTPTRWNNFTSDAFVDLNNGPFDLVHLYHLFAVNSVLET